MTTVRAPDGAPEPDQPRRLVVSTGDRVSTHLLPKQGAVLIGRGAEADVRLDDSSVSRLHVRLHLGPQVRIEDLGSLNGTRIGFTPLRPNEPTVLLPGQTVELGSTWMTLAKGAIVPERPNDEPTAEDDESGPSGRVSTTSGTLIIQDDDMRALHALIAKVAAGDISVVLFGETGVGKEVFARRIHELSRRAHKPFVGINCAALTETLLENELFGHERGAFTGAAQAKPGLLEAAEGGTVLLDEIGETSLAIQIKLLRVLEERQVLRLGATRARPINVRVLSATNRNLEAAVEQGTFRRDFYFRLNGITIEIPPLRQRSAEIEPLARDFIVKTAERQGVRPPPVDPEVWERLRRYRWPGNIRQLRNVMERAVILAGDGRITVEHLPVDTYVGPRPTAPVVSAPAPMVAPAAEAAGPSDDDDERQRILAALESCAGNQTRAAELLGMSRRTLVKRLSQYALPRPRKR